MVKASKGYRRRTRSVMRKRSRDRGLSIRFHGHTGTVTGMQGKAYLLDVRMGHKMKQIIVRPEHLRKA
ncbi:MAG: hypothetical protein LAN71_16895 [Acidobacteriia bacterium]|nr:hypothetical protein [Terriglobia bacterium]